MTDKKDGSFTDADRAALNTMRVHVNKDSNGLAATTIDGKPLPEEAMSAEQLGAFRKFAVLSFPGQKVIGAAPPVSSPAAPKA